MKQDTATHPKLPWWRVPVVWGVIAGPAFVVIAGTVTTVIAVQGADPVVRSTAPTVAQQPALQARNHAAAPRR